MIIPKQKDIKRYTRTSTVWFKDQAWIAYITLNALLQNPRVYEMGSLILKPSERSIRTVKIIVNDILEKYEDVPIVSVLGGSGLIKLHERNIKRIELERDEIPARLLEALENKRPLLPNERIFINQCVKDLINNRSF